MKRRRVVLGLLAGLLAAGALKGGAPAQAGAGYALVKTNIGAGANGSNGGYTLGSSAGQSSVGTVNAGSYQMGVGFWGGGETLIAVGPNLVYLPLVTK
jgi:hypothetical protein